MGGEANRTACSANSGNASTNTGQASVSATPEPIQSPDSLLADLFQLRNLADVYDRRQIALMFGDPESNIRAAGKNQGMRRGFQRRGQFANRSRRAKRGELQRLVRRARALNGLQPRQTLPGLRLFPIPASRRCVLEHPESRIDDRPIARATAQIAGQRDHHIIPLRVATDSDTARTATSQSPACKNHTATHDCPPSPAERDAMRRSGVRKLSTVTSSLPSSVGKNRMQELTAR